MKSFALLSLLVASAMAGQILEEISLGPIPQFSQESNTATGEYGYSYSGGPSAKTEFRAQDGTTTGSYSYVDAHGILQTVNYIADEFGFRVAGTNVPTDGISPLDAPDVAAVKAAHLAEHSRQSLGALVHRKKRGIYAAGPLLEVRAALPAIATSSYTRHVPIATSHQSRFQIHNGAKIVEQVSAPLIAQPALLFRKKRGILTEVPVVAAAAAAAAAPLPPSAAKILDELARKPAGIAYAAPAAVEVRSALPAVAHTSYTQHLPIATSSQSRFQIHNGAKIVEQTSLPAYAPAAIHLAPIASAHFPAAFFPGSPFAPAFSAYPTAPLAPAFPSEHLIADSDAITVDSA